MQDTTGHFLMLNGIPHILLTEMPTELKKHFEAAAHPVEVDASSGSPATLPVVDERPAGPVAAAVAWSNHMVPTANMPHNVHGLLLSLQGIGLHGRRAAESLAKQSAGRILEHGAHAVRMSPKGEVLGWSITPRALKT